MSVMTAKKQALQEIIKKMRILESKDEKKEDKKAPAVMAAGEGDGEASEALESSEASAPDKGADRSPPKKEEVEDEDDFATEKRNFMKKKTRVASHSSKTFVPSFGKETAPVEVKRRPGRPKKAG